MKSNYLAWDIDSKNFPVNKTSSEQLAFLLKYAVLAPSSHNSQPWKFKVSSNIIEISPNMERSLIYSDKNNRQLYISLGCTLTNLLIAADFFELSTEVSINGENHKTIAVSFSNNLNTKENDDTHLLHFIKQRVTNRNNYTATEIPSSFTNWLNSLSTESLQIHIINEQSKRSTLVNTVMEATLEAMSSKDFRRELSEYLKPNTTSAEIGMPAFGMGIPTPVSLIAPQIMKMVNMGKVTYKQEKNILDNHTPSFVIISTSKNNQKNWIKTGQIYQQIALQATKEGLSTNPLAAAIQIGNHYKKIQQVLNTKFHPQFFFRLGYTDKKTKHSPRLSAEKIINQ